MELISVMRIVFFLGLRLTPMDAIRHPFLAPECASGFISSHGNFSRGLRFDVNTVTD